MLEQFHSALRESPAAVVRGGRDGEIGAVGPAADAEEDLEVPVPLLVQVELFGAAVEVGARVVPGVRRPVLVRVGPGVGEVDFARFRADVGEGVEDVGELFGGEVLGLVVAAVAGGGGVAMSVCRTAKDRAYGMLTWPNSRSMPLSGSPLGVPLLDSEGGPK